MHWETVHTEQRGKWAITLAFAPEDTDPRDSFDEAIEAEFDTFGKIERGELLWFVARVEASIDGVVLGTEYLGACCYENAAAFYEGEAADGYYGDMVNAAIAEGEAQLGRLCAA